jgi:hypothetical protein
MKALFIIVIVVLMWHVVMAGDEGIIISGGFEAGIGYNQLFWETAANDLFFDQTSSRTTVYLAPNLRLYAKLSGVDQFFLHSSLGFTEIGGKSKEFKLDPGESEDYVDTFSINVVEVSLLIGYSFEKFNLMVGLKHNIHTSIVLDPPAYFDEEEVYLTEDMPGSSNNVGFRAEYKFSGVILGAEFWFGLSESVKQDTYRYSAGDSYNENHYRLIFAMPIFGSS